MNNLCETLPITWISEGSDGRSRFTEVALPLDDNLRTALSAAATLQFKRSPQGRVMDYHRSPQRQWLLVLAGVVAITCGDERRDFGPGSILYFDDTAGEGHRTVNLQGDRLLAHIGVPESFDAAMFRHHA